MRQRLEQKRKDNVKSWKRELKNGKREEMILRLKSYENRLNK